MQSLFCFSPSILKNRLHKHRALIQPLDLLPCLPRQRLEIKRRLRCKSVLLSIFQRPAAPQELRKSLRLVLKDIEMGFDDPAGIHFPDVEMTATTESKVCTVSIAG